MKENERNRLLEAIRSQNTEQIEFREETLLSPLGKDEYIDVPGKYYYTAEHSEESWAHAVSFHKIDKHSYKWFDSSSTTNVSDLSNVQQLKEYVSDRGTKRKINDVGNPVTLSIVYFVNHSTT